MEKPYKKNTFSILILLSISSSIQIFASNNIGEYQKIILICLNLIYLFMISEYIETVIYYKILQYTFECKNYSSSTIFKVFIYIIPIFSLLIYALAWTLFSFNLIEYPERAFGLLVLIGISNLVFMLQMRYNLVFVNNEKLFIYKKIIPLRSILTHKISNINKMGVEIDNIEITLDSRDVVSLRIDTKKKNEFINKLQSQ